MTDISSNDLPEYHPGPLTRGWYVWVEQCLPHDATADERDRMLLAYCAGAAHDHAREALRLARYWQREAQRYERILVRVKIVAAERDPLLATLISRILEGKVWAS